MAEVLLIEDLIGTTYGRLTILEEGISYQEPNGKRERMMICQCSCGNTCRKRLKELRKGRGKSCGCIHKEQKIEVKSGDKYNYWTIIKEVAPYVDSQNNKSRKFLAKCICEKESEIILNSLRQGSSKSCGCMIEHKKGATGQRIFEDSPIPEISLEKINKRDLGYWKVIEIVSVERNEKAEVIRIVKTQCKCGFIKECNLNTVGGSRQCFECAMKDIKDKMPEEERKTKRRLSHVYNGMRNRCNNINNKDYKSYGAKGIKIAEEFSPFIKFYSWAVHNGYDVNKNLEIDREDSSKGYSPDNCRFITKTENVLRQLNLTVEDVKFIRNEDFDWEIHRSNYKCSDLTINNIINYISFKEV